MGCDYYIVKAFEVLLKDEKIPFLIELERDYGYFGDFSFDEDSPDYVNELEKWEEYKLKRLKSVMLPIVIYEEGAFMNAKLDNKYRLMIEEELFMNKLSWDKVVKIDKIEYCYERD